MPELLAPAGDLERLKIAFIYGADAVYIGGPILGLRANAINFTFEEIKEAVEFAHNLNKKVYVTVNIVLHNKEIKAVDEYLKKLESLKVDAIIVSDIYIIKRALTTTNLEVHLSTQASTMNKEMAKFYKELGVTRIVLARENTKEDILDIINNVDIEIECFIHGAMCSSISGRCAMSNFLTGRDANRGGCAQICRWEFEYCNGNGEKITDIPFSMTPKDLNMVPFIKDMINVGVNSFKIEGRMRSVYYIATVILIYRRLIDKIVNNSITDAYTKYCLNVLNRCANRESTPQFFDKVPGVGEQYYLGRQELSNQDFLGLVIDYKDGMVTLEQRNNFSVGTIVQFFGPNIETFDYKITEILDEDGNSISVARHPQMIVKMKIDNKLNKYDMMRIKVFDI